MSNYDDEMQSAAQEFDISKQPKQVHVWRQEGNQPLLRCDIHHHTAVLPDGVHAQPDENGDFTLVRMG